MLVFYKSLGQTVNEIPASEITATICRTRKPIKLFRDLEEDEKTVSEVAKGIYHICGLVDIPLQVIVTEELDENDFKALRLLKRNVKGDELLDAMTELGALNEPGYHHDAEAVLRVCARINKDLFWKVRGEIIMKDAFTIILEEEVEKEVEKKLEIEIEKKTEQIKEQVTEQITEQITEQGIKIFIEDKIEDGIDPDRVVKKLQSGYKLTEEKARVYVEKYTPFATAN